jgi:hypothetical protein
MKTVYMIIISALVFLMFGCSGSNPLNPDESKSQTGISGNSSGQMHDLSILGSYELVLDLSKQSAELIPKRISDIGQSYIVNGLSYFTISPCADCFKVKSIALTDDGYLQLTFNLRHPFPPGDILKPPSAINRLDLDVFDVALLIHPMDITAQPFPLTGDSVYTGILVENDGYSMELAEVIDDDAAVPYVLVVDDNEMMRSTYNEFAMGSEAEFDAVFSIEGNVSFDLYLTMGYGASATKPSRLLPTYYNPEFNRKSAWKVNVIPPNGSEPPAMGNTWNDSDNSTLFDVTVEVFDWQIGANVNPELVNPSDVFASSEVSHVMLEIPGMHSSIVDVISPDSGSGAPDDPLIYTLSVANQNYLDAGEYNGLVKVVDERIPGTVVVGGETDTMASSPNGIVLEWVNIPEFATYQVFTATVVIGCGPITGSITSPSCPVTGVNTGSSLDFEASASSGNGGDPVILYEWDMDYDGVTFNVNATGDSVILGPFVNPNCGTPPETPVTYTVAVRATDSCSPHNVTIFDSCEVTVDHCNAPSVGNITIKTNRISNSVIDITKPFTLEWQDPSAGYVQYAVYADLNPTDGLMNNFVYVGATTTLSFDDPGTNFPSNHYIAGWTYIVRGRTVMGNPGSEGVDSEPAYVTFNGWETLPNRANPGIGNNGEGWLVNHQLSNTHFMSWPNAYGDNYQCAGMYSMWYTPFCNTFQGASYSGIWQGMTKETPVIPNSSVRFVEFGGRIWQINYGQGIILGTIDVQPYHNFTNTTDFEWADAEHVSPYYGYTVNSAEIASWAGDVATDRNNSWAYPGWDTAYHVCGGDVNIDGDPSDPYVGIELYNNEPYQPYFMMDEVSIMIY